MVSNIEPGVSPIVENLQSFGQITVTGGGLTGGSPGDFPGQEATVSIGEAESELNTGSLRLSHPLDFDQSPGTSVGGDPALVYNSATVDPRPVVEATLATDPSAPVPSSIQAQLTWGMGPAQPWVTFQTTGHAPGDSYLLSVQVATPVTSSGVYYWTLHVREIFANAAPVDAEITGSTGVVTNAGNLGVPSGWGISGVDHLVFSDRDTLWVNGSGDCRVFTSGFSSPPGDFGQLCASTDSGDPGFVYTAVDETRWYFDPSGLLTHIVAPDGVTRSYHYDDSGRLIEVDAPDGGVTRFIYRGGRLSVISEPGNRQVGLTYDQAGNFVKLVDVDGTTRCFGYDEDGRLITDHWGPISSTFTYNTTVGCLASVYRGSGDLTRLIPAESEGLQTSPAQGVGAEGQAIVQDPLGHTTVYTVDSDDRLLRIDAPLGRSQIWQRDGSGAGGFLHGRRRQSYAATSMTARASMAARMTRLTRPKLTTLTAEWSDSSTTGSGT